MSDLVRNLEDRFSHDAALYHFLSEISSLLLAQVAQQVNLKPVCSKITKTAQKVLKSSCSIEMSMKFILLINV